MCVDLGWFLLLLSSNLRILATFADIAQSMIDEYSGWSLAVLGILFQLGQGFLPPILSTSSQFHLHLPSLFSLHVRVRIFKFHPPYVVLPLSSPTPGSMAYCTLLALLLPVVPIPPSTSFTPAVGMQLSFPLNILLLPLSFVEVSVSCCSSSSLLSVSQLQWAVTFMK